MVGLLCGIAQRKLANCYSKENLLQQYAISDNHKVRLSMASNLRYIIISQIGIKRWLRFHNHNDVILPNLWEYICSKEQQINSAGDLGLAIWAGIESDADNCGDFAEKLANNWGRLRALCNAIELAWVVAGMVNFSQYQSMSHEMADVLMDAHNRLVGLYCQSSRLFARHNREGFKEIISRRIACFADQVYPIVALANYGRVFGDNESVAVAEAVADTICRLQGLQGQWWWHYDVKTGAVAEEYPVFSVHQDGMAPMALLAVDDVAGTDHSNCIERGLVWLNGGNEAGEAIIVPEKDIVWRDIHRREIGKMYRLARGTLIVSGLHTAHRWAGKNLFGYVINKECRPYHLGWILYAWADRF